MLYLESLCYSVSMLTVIMLIDAMLIVIVLVYLVHVSCHDDASARRTNPSVKFTNLFGP
jgi:hypothetical protein